eukprot:4160484-Alexandrium_andersonii.AAC.1
MPSSVPGAPARTGSPYAPSMPRAPWKPGPLPRKCVLVVVVFFSWGSQGHGVRAHPLARSTGL